MRNAGRTFNPQDVASVEIRVTETAARYPGCDNAAPLQTLQAAIMSLQFSVASVLASGDIRERNWQEFTDATVAALAARSRVIVDDRLTAAFPALQGAGVRVELTDGHVCENAANDFCSMSRDEVVERFLEAAAPHLGRNQAQATIMCVDRLEQVSDIRSLTGRLRTAR